MADPVQQSTDLSPGREMMAAWEAKRDEIAALDERRRVLLDEARGFLVQAIELGRKEGWHV